MCSSPNASAATVTDLLVFGGINLRVSSADDLFFVCALLYVLPVWLLAYFLKVSLPIILPSSRG